MKMEVESPTTNYIKDAIINFIPPVEIKVERDLKILQTHLTDHDYIVLNPKSSKPRQKKPKKQLTITQLRAIFNCTTCGYRSMDRDNLYKHICTKNAKYTLRNTSKNLLEGYKRCPKCNFSTNNMSNLRLHMVIHTEGVQKNCIDCDISKNCVDKTYKCPNCSYTSKNPSSLKLHMHVHSRGTPYKCMECSFPAKDLKDLIRHYNLIKDIHCKCGYATHIKQQMVTHKRSHSAENPFSCGICNYSSRNRAGLQRHMNKHNITKLT